MAEKLLSAFIGYVVVGIVLALLVSPGMLGNLIVFLGSLGAAIWVYRSLNLIALLHDHRKPQNQNIVPVASTIVAFGIKLDRPAFLNNVKNFYDWKQPADGYYLNDSDQIKRAGVGPLKASLLNERRMFESLIESARYEMLRRGHPIVDRLNRHIYPTIRDEGLLIETIQLDDGRTAHIFAVDVLGGLDRDAWMKAYQHGVGRFAGSWNEIPLANRKRYWIPFDRTIEYNDPDAGVIPLFAVKLQERISKGAATVDPLERADGGVSYDFPEEWR